MDFTLSDEQRAFQETARDFAHDEWLPHAPGWDEREEFPVEALRRAAALGFAGIYVKDQFGGSGLTRLDAALIFEGFAKACRRPVDPQHGGLDDRPLRRRGAARPLSAEAEEHGAFRQLLPD